MKISGLQSSTGCSSLPSTCTQGFFHDSKVCRIIKERKQRQCQHNHDLQAVRCWLHLTSWIVTSSWQEASINCRERLLSLLRGSAFSDNWISSCMLSVFFEAQRQLIFLITRTTFGEQSISYAVYISRELKVLISTRVTKKGTRCLCSPDKP
jgi:hypothetical protein